MAREISIDMHLIIGVLLARGTIPKHQFRNLYIFMNDYTYPDIPLSKQALLPGLRDWILVDRMYNMPKNFPADFLYATADICVCLGIIYSIEDQKEILSLIQMRDNKQNRG